MLRRWISPGLGVLVLSLPGDQSWNETEVTPEPPMCCPLHQVVQGDKSIFGLHLCSCSSHKVKMLLPLNLLEVFLLKVRERGSSTVQLLVRCSKMLDHRELIWQGTNAPEMSCCRQRGVLLFVLSCLCCSL